MILTGISDNWRTDHLLEKSPQVEDPRKTHYTITEAAEKLEISRAAVNEAIRAGRLEAEKDKLGFKRLIETVEPKN